MLLKLWLSCRGRSVGPVPMGRLRNMGLSAIVESLWWPAALSSLGGVVQNVGGMGEKDPLDAMEDFDILVEAQRTCLEEAASAQARQDAKQERWEGDDFVSALSRCAQFLPLWSGIGWHRLHAVPQRRIRHWLSIASVILSNAFECGFVGGSCG